MAGGPETQGEKLNAAKFDHLKRKTDNIMSGRLGHVLNKPRERGADLFDVIRGLSRKLILREKTYGFNKLARQVHAATVKKGFWPAGRSDTECIALMHSELSEVLEALRDPIMPKYPYAFALKFRKGMPPEPVGFVGEMADYFIRGLDLCGARRADIDRAIAMKIKYNKAREYKHGKKF
jgi:hypothetical protein